MALCGLCTLSRNRQRRGSVVRKISFCYHDVYLPAAIYAFVANRV